MVRPSVPALKTCWHIASAYLCAQLKIFAEDFLHV